MTETSTQQPVANPEAEALRITDAALGASVNLRIAGGVGVAMRCPSTTAPPLNRPYADIDMVGARRDRAAIAKLLVGLGYRPDDEFNALHGDTRLYFWDSVNSRQVDVFLDAVEMCHTIALRDRLGIHDRTLSLADLLLLKLQIVETNHKDFLDILALLSDQPLTDDETGINVSYIAKLTSRDWGLWKTTTMVAERAAHFAGELEAFTGRERIHDQVKTLLASVETAPKSRGWKVRATLGERKRWYELPDEAH